MNEIVSPPKRISGRVELPGDKSISHRALMLGSIANGTTRIENLSQGQDVDSTRACLQHLGVQFEKNGSQLLVHGVGLCGFHPPRDVLNVGNSGTTMRLLAGLLAGQAFAVTLTGDDSIRRRPMARIIDPLSQMGVKISAADAGLAPLRIEGGAVSAIHYEPPVASAQVKSCVLLAGLYAEGVTSVSEKSQTRDHTERMLQTFGASIKKTGLQVSVSGRPKLFAQDLFIPGDFSAAAYFIAAATLLSGSHLTLGNVGINPSRKAFLSVLMEMGARIEILNVTNLQNELVANLHLSSSSLRGIQIDGQLVPQLIDEIPILSVLATQAEGTTQISDAAELRVKESDRLHALTTNLRKMGAMVEENEDGLIIEGPTPLKQSELDSFGDHRIAMACSIAALVADGPCQIKNSVCTSVSFPDFYETLKEISVA